MADDLLGGEEALALGFSDTEDALQDISRTHDAPFGPFSPPSGPDSRAAPLRSTSLPANPVEPQRPRYPRDCCVVCLNGDSESDNKILYCDSCDVAVHQVRMRTCSRLRPPPPLRPSCSAQACYGIESIPDGPWHCRRCEDPARRPPNRASAIRRHRYRRRRPPRHSPKCIYWIHFLAAPPQCSLCKRRDDGAFKRTVDGELAHVLCALWLPEVRSRTPAPKPPRTPQPDPPPAGASCRR